MEPQVLLSISKIDGKRRLRLDSPDGQHCLLFFTDDKGVLSIEFATNDAKSLNEAAAVITVPTFGSLGLINLNGGMLLSFIPSFQSKYAYRNFNLYY